MENSLRQIINHYGVMKQLKYIHSEYFELDEAIIDYESAGWDFGDESCEDIEKTYTHHIAEEIADVMVMLEQFRLHYGITKEEIDTFMEYKVHRQLERIEEGK